MSATSLGGLFWKLFCAASFCVVPVFLSAQTIPSSNSDTPNVPVYVSDFELGSVAVGPQPPATARPPAANDNPSATSATPPAAAPPATTTGSATTTTNTLTGGTPPPAGMLVETDTPSARARKLMDYFTLTLIQTLQKSKYTASHPTSGGGPSSGLMVRGVFTEIDPGNHIRKALLGSASTNPQFTVYVGIYDLSRQEQPLYQIASVQASDNRFGPTITLNNYVPMAKYDLAKNPTADDVQKICNQIVNNLTALIKANPEAFNP